MVCDHYPNKSRYKQTIDEFSFNDFGEKMEEGKISFKMYNSYHVWDIVQLRWLSTVQKKQQQTLFSPNAVT